MQEINFYNSLPKPNRYAINAKRARFIIVTWIILLLLFSLLQFVYVSFQGIRLSYFQHEEKTLTKTVDTFIQQYPTVKQAYLLENNIRDYLDRINHQTTFSKEIANYNRQNADFKPSHYLHELANATTPHVWLTEIHFQKQGQDITLNGFTYNASLLIQYVSTLQKEVDFKNKPFNKVTVVHEKEAAKLPFIISTKEDQKP